MYLNLEKNDFWRIFQANKRKQSLILKDQKDFLKFNSAVLETWNQNRSLFESSTSRAQMYLYL